MATPLDRVALVLSIVSVGLAGYATWTTTSMARDARRTEADAALEARLATLEAAVRPSTEAHAPALAAAPTAGAAGLPAAGAAGSGGTSDPTGSAPTTLPEVAERLVALEKMWKTAAETMTVGGQQEIVQPVAPAEEGAGAWYGNLEGAAVGLALTAPQKAEFERTVADAKRAIDELHKVPDETGVTWDQAMKDGVSIENGNVSYDGTKIRAYREKVIPGRNESYGAADRRLRTEAKGRMREALSRDQQEKFDKSNVDGLLPGGDSDGGFMTIFNSFSAGSIHFGGLTPPEPPERPAPER